MYLLGSVLHQSFQKLALRYGPFMLIRAGASSSYIVSNGAITKEIFKTNDINFAARPEFGSSEYQITKTPCFPLWTIARTDTTSVALQWALAELLNHPKAIKKLQQEIDRIVGVKNRLAEDLDIQNLPYLQAVVKETLRLHPSLPLVFRKCREDCEINGYKILKDSRLVVNLYAVNRDSNVWADADDFVPKRYLNLNENLAIEPDELEAIKEDQNFCYMPFGGRRRGCPGAGLAAAVLHRTLVQ
uniref:3,9-dihydroxypterocarpan 6A-monooxygenase-like n=1 Tax=Nicotiana tabacum TaxID=4097 RepID=A0A1S3X8V3_TOBAC|nr:PREDICTED: 3,9-dihydroxypterocarpan 6A-monooxygenase-like [Nicotiana tabacum]